MAHDYPRYGADLKLDKKGEEVYSILGKTCECCIKDTPITHRVDVQVDQFRGNDDVYYVCPNHVGMARQYDKFKKFLHDYRKKQEHIGVLKKRERTDGNENS